jgi:hypothetical protein
MKIAACFSRGTSESISTVRKMLQAQSLEGNQTGTVLDLPGGAIGWIETADRFSSIPRIYRSASGNILLVAGVPIDVSGGDVKFRLSGSLEAGAGALATELKKLDGIFAALFWDAATETLQVLTDFLGLQPLYAFHQPDLLLLASEQNGIAASQRLVVEADPAGWGAFVGIGNTLANSTQLKGVVRVDPGSRWTFHPPSGQLDRSTYWHWPQPDPGAKRAGLDLDALLCLLDREVHAYLAHCCDTTLLLSGGVDSRFLLALLDRNGIRPQALIAKHPDELLGADNRFAVQLARRYCSTYTQVSPPRDFFSSPGYLQYLQMTDVGTRSLYLFITVLPHFIHNRPALWDGLFPNVTVFPPDYGVRTLREYVKRVCAPRDSARWRGAALAFNPRLAEAMYDSLQQAVNQQLAVYPDDEYGIHQFYVRNRTRNRIGPNPCRVYANRSLAYTPGVSKNFWSLIVPLAHAEKAGHALYYDLFRKYFPGMLAVPLCTRGKIITPQRAGFSNQLFSRTATWLSNYYVGRTAERLGLRSRLWWEESRLVDAVLARIDLGHPELNTDGVRRLQDSVPQADSAEAEGRHWLFYWQVWRWMMQGDLPQVRESMLSVPWSQAVSRAS